MPNKNEIDKPLLRMICESVGKLTEHVCECLPKLTDAYCRYVDTIVKDSEEVRAAQKSAEEARKRFFESTKGKIC